ncbi:MAG: hypothetical protein DI551_12305, partial [Micavibrio aeruginosavorus]
TWGGSSSKLIANGDNKIVSDEVFATSFGLAKFDRNSTVYIKGRGSVPVAGNLVPSHLPLESQISGSQQKWYNPADTTPSAVNAAGAFTFTGTATGGSNRVHTPFLLGRPVDAGTLVYFGLGDSILMGSHDNLNTGNNGVYGVGLHQRAMHDGSFTNPYPSCNFSLSSMYASAMTGSNNKWAEWCVYANRGIDEMLTNDIINAGASLATCQSRAQEIWTKMKTNGIQKILRTGLLTRTNSTDSWATLAGQTVNGTDWDTGGKVLQFNAWAQTRVGIDIEGYVELSSILDATDKRFWLTNGTAMRVTDDGLHPYSNGANGVGNELGSSDVRAALATLA